MWDGRRDGRRDASGMAGGINRPAGWPVKGQADTRRSASAVFCSGRPVPFPPALRSGCSQPVSTSAHHPARSRRPSAASGGRLAASQSFLATQVPAQRKPLVRAFDGLLHQTVNVRQDCLSGAEVPPVLRAQAPYGSITCEHLRGDGRRLIFLLGVWSTEASTFG